MTKVKMKDEIKIREQLTNTSYFLLPVFKVPIVKLDEYGFINSYLFDTHMNLEEKEGKLIYLLFKPDEKQSLELGKQLIDWQNNKFYVHDYDYDEGYVVVVLRFPDKYLDQYKLFLSGSYSKFSEEYQNEIPRKVSRVLPSSKLDYEGDSLQFLVINKRVKLKNYWKNKLDVDLTPDMEYWSIPDTDKETLDIDKVIKK